jgi:hypothetical protein
MTEVVMFGLTGSSARALIAACAVVMTISAGCDAPADETGQSSEAYVCTTVGTSAWWNQSFTEQTGHFHMLVDVTPSAGDIDGVVGLSPGPATTWSKLAAIVRFNPDGYIDARSGGTYKADLAYRYTANLRYRIDIDVDVAAHTYSVTVDDTRNTVVIARGYPFRTEQAGVTRLANISAFTNPETGPGSMLVCNPTVSATAPPPPGCITPNAGDGFFNLAITPSSTVQLVTLTAIAGRENMDGVIGLSSGPAYDYNDFAASIRFWTSGYLEARDGDMYRADAQIPYRQAEHIQLEFILDLPSKTYSVFALPDGELDWIELARGYKFRPQQANVTTIDNVAMVIASDLGGLSRCDVHANPPGVLAFRDGLWDVQPLADGSAVISDGATTVKLDAGNVPRATLPVGGKVTVDPAGNVYVASIANGTLTLRSYTPAFAPRWTTNVASDAYGVEDILVNSAGHVAVSVNENGASGRTLHRFDTTGHVVGATVIGDSMAMGLSTNHYVVAHWLDNGVEVQVFAYGGGLVRARTIPGQFYASRIAIAPDDSVVLGGNVYEAVDFGGCTVEPYPSSQVSWNAYVTALRSDLSVRFCDRLTSEIQGLTTTGSQIAVAYTTLTQMWYPDMIEYDAAGNILRGSSENSIIGTYGFADNVFLGANGRMYLSERAGIGGPNSGYYPFLFVLP